VAPKCSAEVTFHHSFFIALANGGGAVRADTSEVRRNGVVILFTAACITHVVCAVKVRSCTTVTCNMQESCSS
jgi:hypothetical protein